MTLGFKRQFEAHVQDGSKRHTVRGGARWKVGMRADLYIDPRQKGMRLLFRAHVVRVQTIRIAIQQLLPFPEFAGLRVAKIPDHVAVWIDGQQLSPDEVEHFFWSDGFRQPRRSATAQAIQFWRKRLPFSGQIVHWDYDRRFTQLPEKRRRKPKQQAA